MIYKYIKCEAVIAKVMADLDSTEVRLRISDIREWIFEAIDKIGAPMLYIQRESGVDGVPIFKIEDNLIPLPSDLESIDGVAYSKTEKGPWTSMSTATSIFKHPNSKPKLDMHVDDIDKANLVPDKSILQDKPNMLYKYPTTQSLMIGVNGMKYFERIVLDGKFNKPEYFIKPGWIVTNMNEGYIKLSYKAIATDERGYPLIPDLSSYQEAVYWYVAMKLNFPKFLKGKLGGKGVNNNAMVYNYLRTQWAFYRSLAYAEAMMPTEGDMLNIKRDWNKLIPDWDGDETFYGNIGKQQSVYNDFYYGY